MSQHCFQKQAYFLLFSSFTRRMVIDLNLEFKRIQLFNNYACLPQFFYSRQQNNEHISQQKNKFSLLKVPHSFHNSQEQYSLPHDTSLSKKTYLIHTSLIYRNYHQKLHSMSIESPFILKQLQYTIYRYFIYCISTAFLVSYCYNIYTLDIILYPIYTQYMSTILSIITSLTSQFTIYSAKSIVFMLTSYPFNVFIVTGVLLIFVFKFIANTLRKQQKPSKQVIREEQLQVKKIKDQISAIRRQISGVGEQILELGMIVGINQKKQNENPIQQFFYRMESQTNSSQQNRKVQKSAQTLIKSLQQSNQSA